MEKDKSSHLQEQNGLSIEYVIHIKYTTTKKKLNKRTVFQALF